MEVARQTGVSRETLRRWANQYEVLKKLVEIEAKKVPMLWRQKQSWNPERRKMVAERERKHQKELGLPGKIKWSARALIALPPGVEPGKRAIWVVRPANPLGYSLWGLALVLRTTRKSVFILAWAKGDTVVRKVKPGSLTAWIPQQHDPYFTKEHIREVAKFEREHFNQFSKK
jgi:hypothetical protein